MEGPVFLIRTNNTRLVLLVMNQNNKHNPQFEVGDHIQFELKKESKPERTDYYLNMRITDTIAKTRILGIWSMDPRME